MLDRAVVREFLEREFEGTDIRLPPDITMDNLVETFCLYVEDDYYEWLKDNFKSFIEHEDRDWEWIRGRIEYYRQ